jgi:hypothetical protein
MFFDQCYTGIVKQGKRTLFDRFMVYLFNHLIGRRMRRYGDPGGKAEEINYGQVQQIRKEKGNTLIYASGEEIPKCWNVGASLLAFGEVSGWIYSFTAKISSKKKGDRGY